MGERLNEYVLQGIPFLLGENANCCTFIIAFREDISILVLEKAINAALERLPYFRLEFIYEEGKVFSSFHEGACCVFSDGDINIPEDSNGFLFAFSCKGRILRLNYHHSLSDGHGAMVFLREVLVSYVNICYGNNLPEKAYSLYTSYDIECILKEHHPLKPLKTQYTSNISIPSHSQRYRFILPFQTIENMARSYHVHPFSVLATLLMEPLVENTKNGQLHFNYAMDMRYCIQDSEILYNFCSYVNSAISKQDSFSERIRKIDRQLEDVKHDPENLLEKYSATILWCKDILNLTSIPFSRKKRIFNMGRGMVIKEPYISYIGDAFYGLPKEVSGMIEDYAAWVAGMKYTMFIPFRIRDQMVICVESYDGQKLVPEALKASFHAHGINGKVNYDLLL